MIDLPPAGGGNRTRDLVVESRRVQDHWAIPVIPSKWYPKYPLVQKNGGGIHLGPTSKTQNLGFWVFDVGPRSEIGHPHWIRALALRAKILGAKSKWRF